MTPLVAVLSFSFRSPLVLRRELLSVLRGGFVVFLLAMLALPVAAETKRIGPKLFDAKELLMVDVIGSIEITVGEGPKIEVVLEGEPRLLEDLSLRGNGDTLVIARKKDWLDFPERQLYPWRDVYPSVTLRLPAGTPITLDGVIGEARIGDIAAPLAMEVSLLDAKVGDVSDATLKLHGRGDIALGKVAGRLSILSSGSSEVTVGDVGQAEIKKSGSGDIALGVVAGGLSYDSAGSGDTRVAAVNGLVEVLINGSGGLRIGGGEASPLRLRLNGSGDFRIEGTAVNPDVTINGSGSVRVQTHRGTLRLRSFSGAVTYDEQGGVSITQ